VRLEYAADVVLVEHTWAGWMEQRDVDGLLGLFADIFASQSGTVLLIPEFHALRADAMVITGMLSSGRAEGGYEQLGINFCHIGPDGIDRIETFPPDQLADALAAFHATAEPHDVR
jgi:hypothetical protein